VIGCAAAYAYHLTKAHAFVEGNKRVAAVVTETFLNLNGIELKATDEELFDLYLGIADGSLSRVQVERKLRSRSREG
jgi:death-on-curing protein